MNVTTYVFSSFNGLFSQFPDDSSIDLYKKSIELSRKQVKNPGVYLGWSIAGIIIGMMLK